MDKYDLDDILTGSDLFLEYDGKLIKELIGMMNQFNFNLILCSPDVEGDQIEEWIETEYKTIGSFWRIFQLKL